MEAAEEPSDERKSHQSTLGHHHTAPGCLPAPTPRIDRKRRVERVCPGRCGTVLCTLLVPRCRVARLCADDLWGAGFVSVTVKLLPGSAPSRNRR